MKQTTFAKKIQPVKDLLALARSYQTGNTGEWVALGLITAEEYADYMNGSAVESKMWKVGRDAEEAVQRPDCFDQYPKEYQAILKRLAVLEPDVKLVKDTWEMLRGLTSMRGNRYSDGSSFGSRLGISDAADLAFAFFKDLPGEDGAEYNELKATQERRSQRDGTVVRRINHANYDSWEAERRKAKVAAMEAFALEPANAAAIARKKEVEDLVDRRQDEKVRGIGKAIRECLVKALAESNQHVPDANVRQEGGAL